MFIVSKTENCGRFWFQPKECLPRIQEMFDELNNPNNDLELFGGETDVEVGEIVAAVFPSGGRGTEFYRAKVIHIERKRETTQTAFEV